MGTGARRWTAVMLVAFLALAIPASARRERPAAACLAFTPEIELLFRQVAAAIHLTVREDVPRPCLRDAASMDQADFSRLIGTEVSRPFNAYLPQINTIVLMAWRPDALAHEFVHYFQVSFQRWDLAGDTRDWAERQATAIQNLFRARPPLRIPGISP